MSKNAAAANAVAASDTSQKDPTKSIATAPLARLEDATDAPAEPTFDSEVGDLQKAAKNATNAEKAFKRTFVELCKKLYAFGKKYEQEQKKIEEWLDEKGLKVTAKANNWTPVVKLAFAEQKADGTWEVSNQQVNKYANVMRYAETVTFTSMEDWIGERTLTELIAAARVALRETNGDDEKTEDKIKHHLHVLEAKWEPFFKKGWNKVDLTEAPIQKGPVQIMANVDDAGKITPVGILQVDEPKLLNLLTPPKSKTLSADELSESVSGVRTLYPFADVLPMSADIQRSIILDVAKDKWRMYVCVPNIWSSPLAEATFAQPHQQLPVGKWFLDSAKQKALSFLLNNFPADMISVSVNKTHCLISVQDSAKKTVDAQICEIDERKEKSWRTSKEKGNKVKETPSKFDWPAEIKNNNNTLLLPDASGMDVAKLHQNVQWIDTEIAVSKQFRESVASFCDGAKAAVIYKARFGVTQMSVFHTHGGDPLERIKYGKKAKDGLETFFVFDKNDISRAMRAVNYVIGSLPCQLSVSDGDTVLRLSAEQNGGEFNIYIPAGQGGFGYVGNEFSKGRLA